MATGWTLNGNQLTTNDNVGIGTPNPAFPLHLALAKALRLEGGSNAADNADYFSFGGNGSFGIDSPGVPNGRFVVLNNGHVGVGTPTPAGKFTVVDHSAQMRFMDALGVALLFVSTSGNSAVFMLENQQSEWQIRVDGANGLRIFETNSGGFLGLDNASNLQVTGNETVGGNLQVARGATVVGDLQVTGNATVMGDILLPGADCAEEFDVGGSAALEPGTVVVMDDSGALRESQEAYDKKVAGVISGAGEYRHGLLLDRKPSHTPRVPLALVGKTYCKVDASYSQIQVGDLLTTSPTAGHAMKATDSSRAFGCTIGKALRVLDHGQGLIPILIALQ
jgi:hypothetical protein